MAARVYRPWRERPPAFVRAFTYAPWLVANLHLDAAPSAGAGAPLAWDNVIYDSDSLGYVVATHPSLRMEARATVVTYYLPFAGQEPALARRARVDAPIPCTLAIRISPGFRLFEEAYHWGSRAGARAAANLGRPLDASSVRP